MVQIKNWSKKQNIISNMCSLVFFCVTRRILHIPVMLSEVIQGLNLKPNGKYLDMTFGAGGHSECMLKSVGDLHLIALDRDPFAYKIAKNFENKYNKFTALKGKFSDLPQLLTDMKIPPNSFDGILFDLGCSSMQFDCPERGFSLSRTGPLDMRMDGIDGSLTAADIVSYCQEHHLAKILKIYGEVKAAKKIARAIVESRYMLKKLRFTTELATLVAETLGYEYGVDKLQRRQHAATCTFQALRMFVNNEANELHYGLQLAYHYLKPGGRVAVLTFHSLEDTIVKQEFQCVTNHMPSHVDVKWRNAYVTFNNNEMKAILPKRWNQIHKHVMVPSDEEVEQNPRSRSAKLRIAVKCDLSDTNKAMHH